MFFNPCSEAAVSFSDVRQLTARAAKFVYNTALELFIRSVFQVQIGVAVRRVIDRDKCGTGYQ